MTRSILHFLILALVLLLVQVLVLDNVCLFNLAVPIVFVYIIFKLPAAASTGIVLTISFLTGLVVDIFADTYGMNALACTITGMSRGGILNLFMPRGEEMADPSPSSRTMGRGRYLRYMSVMTFLYCAIIFLVQAFTFFNFWLTAARIIASTVLSLLLMLAVDSLTSRRHEKRL